MKKITIACATLALFAFASSAQAQTTKTKVKVKPATSAAAKEKTKTTATAAVPATATATAPAAKLEDYAGAYAVENLPFDEMVISVKDGKLFCLAGDRTMELKPTKKADSFDTGQAIMTFQRDSANKVTGMEADAQGMIYEGKKK